MRFDVGNCSERISGESVGGALGVMFHDLGNGIYGDYRKQIT